MATGGASARASRPLLPTQMGRYRLCADIASGGMATVYLALAEGPEGFSKPFALKRIHPHLVKEKEFVNMFHDEARIASLLSHPNVCGVIDFGEVDGTPFLTMEYLVGETLADISRVCAIQTNTSPPERRAWLISRLLVDACEGLHAAHELCDPSGNALNVVHRDVSPNNLFVTYSGTLRVVDFGVASAANRLHHTKTGTVKGKFAYMPPEQLRGRRVDRRADVWSLGVVLWELLTLRRLFRRRVDAETVVAVLSDDIVAPSALCSALPKELDRICLKALSRDPSERYDTTREFGRELSRALKKSDFFIGRAELAEWMSELFPNGRREKRNLIKSAFELCEAEPEDSSPEGLPTTKHLSLRDRLAAIGEPMSDQTEISVDDSFEFIPAAYDDELDPSIVIVESGVVERPKKPWTLTRWPAIIGVLVIAMGIASGLTLALVNRVDPSREPPAAHKAASAKTPTDRQQNDAEAESNAEHEAVEHFPSSPASEASPGEPEEGLRQGEGQRTTTRIEESVLAAAAAERPAALRTRGATSDRVVESESGSEPEREPAPARWGIVNVATPGGWADVYLGSRRLGQTPGRFSVPEGPRILTLRPNGDGPPRQVRVIVDPDVLTRVRVDFRETP